MTPYDPNIWRKPTTTTIGGSTKGTMMRARMSDFPRNLSLARSIAPGNPTRRAKTVLRLACINVNAMVNRVLYADSVSMNEVPFPDIRPCTITVTTG